MHGQLKYLLWALTLTGLIPVSAAADNIDMLMSNLFPQEELTYIGFDSIEREDIPVSSGVERKYLIVDFRSAGPRDRKQELVSVHRVCKTLLGNRDLVRNLTHKGYDMVSVAFDRHYQYDCL